MYRRGLCVRWQKIIVPCCGRCVMPGKGWGDEEVGLIVREKKYGVAMVRPYR